jgi:hypothetical protein
MPLIVGRIPHHSQFQLLLPSKHDNDLTYPVLEHALEESSM